MSEHVLRDATLDDARRIAEVHVQTWRDAYSGIVPASYLDALDIDDRTKRWRQRISDPDGPIRVVTDDGRVVGWSCYGRTRDTDTGRIGELYGIYVSSAYWGAGVGPMLMDDCLAWLRERFAAATLWTLDANARARTFYERHGWTFDGTTKDDDTSSTRGFALREVRYRVTFA